MQVPKISNQNYNQNFKASFLQDNALKKLRTTLSKKENAILDKQFKLIGKVEDGKVFGYEENGNRSRIYELVNIGGNDYKSTIISDSRENFHSLFNALHNEYKLKFIGSLKLD